jgi:hypothetical protein
MSDFDSECPRCNGQGIAQPKIAQSKPSAAVPSAASVPDEATQKTAKGCCGCMTIFVLLAIISSLFGGNKPNTDYLVKNSEWDSSVPAVTNYLKKNLNDPDSVQYIEWSKVAELPEGIPDGRRYLVRCKYRAKNSFGGYVIENQIFALDKDGGVISVGDMK